MRPATLAEAPGSAGRAGPFAEQGRTAVAEWLSGSMGRRRVRWANVGGLAALAGAAALIATGGSEPPAPPTGPRPLSPPRPPAREPQQLPRLRDIPRLVRPRPRERRALRRGPRRGPPSVIRDIRGEETAHPGNRDPSPQTGRAGQPGAAERRAPAPVRRIAAPGGSAPAPPPPSPVAEFTPDPGP